MARYGRLALEMDAVHGLVLRSTDLAVLEEVLRAKAVVPLVGPRIDVSTVAVPRTERGRLKQALLKVGWPAEDRAGYVDGASFIITPAGLSVFRSAGTSKRPSRRLPQPVSGVVVLPCGAGKTLVGIGAMAAVGAHTLVLVTNVVAPVSGEANCLARTTLGDREIGEYSANAKISVLLLLHLPDPERPPGELVPAHGGALGRRLGARRLRRGPPSARSCVPDDGRHPGRRRLGLTATLVREDGREGDVSA